MNRRRALILIAALSLAAVAVAIGAIAEAMDGCEP